MNETTKNRFDPCNDPRSDVARRLNEFPYFTARPARIINPPGVWETCEVGVFQHDSADEEKLIGTYKRNYRFLDTFWWFRRGERHFALYSPDYTVTRMMEIFPGQGLKDIGGEEPTSGGFCPVEFYVPDSREHISQQHAGPGEPITNWNDPLSSLPMGCEFVKNSGTEKGRAKLRGPDGTYLRTEAGWVWGEQQDYESGWIKYPPNHGFVAGCIWGDDCSWKIQYLDLSLVEKGVIKREERFGYIELPRSVRLRDAIHLYGLPGTARVHIAISTEWDLATGKMNEVGVPMWD